MAYSHVNENEIVYARQRCRNIDISITQGECLLNENARGTTTKDNSTKPTKHYQHIFAL